MNVYKIIKLSILLVTGVLVSCAPNEQQQQNKKESNSNNTKSSIAQKVQTKTIASNKKQTFPYAPGLKVYIDPDTGQFLDKPPPGYVAPVIKSTQNKTNSKNSNGTPEQAPSDKEQKSSTPGGGYYIKVPAPY